MVYAFYLFNEKCQHHKLTIQCISNINLAIHTYIDLYCGQRSNSTCFQVAHQ